MPLQRTVEWFVALAGWTIAFLIAFPCARRALAPLGASLTTRAVAVSMLTGTRAHDGHALLDKRSFD